MPLLRVGNVETGTRTFTIDKTAPAIDLSGFTPGAFYKTAVTPVFSATDANLDRVKGALDGA